MCALPHIDPMFPTTEHVGLGTKEWELDWLPSPSLSVTHLGNVCFLALLGLGSGKLAVLALDGSGGSGRKVDSSTKGHHKFH